MRPSPDEVIAGVRTILKQDVAPSLPASAQAQLKRVMAVLRDGRWNEAGFDLLRENAAFARLACDCADRIDHDSGLPRALAGPLRAAAGHGMPATFAAANEINRELRSVLSGVLEIARDHRLAALDDPCAAIGATLLALRTT